MPGRKKKTSRPSGPVHSDSLRADIEAQRVDAQPGDDGFDIADALLASLDARDAASADRQNNAEESEAASTASDGNRQSGDALSVSGGPASHAQAQGRASGTSLSIPSQDTGGSLSPSTKSEASKNPGKRISQDLKAASGRFLDGIRSHIHAGTSAPHGNYANSQGCEGLSSVFHARRNSNAPSPKFQVGALPVDESSIASSASPSLQQSGLGSTGRKPNRAKVRLERRAAASEAARQEAEMELKSNGGKPDEAAIERRGIDELCRALGRVVHEVEPDGHCLYAAVADQLNILRGLVSITHGARHATGGDAEALTYKDTRRAAAKEMRDNPDDFMPFISDSDEKMAGIFNSDTGKAGNDSKDEQDRIYFSYCDAVENTGVWGGQPEILALSRAFRTQIKVVQVGYPTLNVGEGEYGSSAGVTGDSAAYISYHRRMYGLGEHYNSLRKKA